MGLAGANGSGDGRCTPLGSGSLFQNEERGGAAAGRGGRGRGRGRGRGSRGGRGRGRGMGGRGGRGAKGKSGFHGAESGVSEEGTAIEEVVRVVKPAGKLTLILFEVRGK